MVPARNSPEAARAGVDGYRESARRLQVRRLQVPRRQTRASPKALACVGGAFERRLCNGLHLYGLCWTTPPDCPAVLRAAELAGRPSDGQSARRLDVVGEQGQEGAAGAGAALPALADLVWRDGLLVCRRT